MDGWMDGWVGGLMGGWMGGWAGGRAGGRTDGRTDGTKYFWRVPHNELRLHIPNVKLGRLFRLFVSLFSEIMSIKIRTTY